MITLKEILKDVEIETLPQKHRDNLIKLLDMLNKLRTAYGRPMRVSSGYRSMDTHLRIYREKGITDKAKIPMKSKHLFCLACDFADPDDKLKVWVGANMPLMESIGLWFEDFNATIGWLHVQIVPYGSWKPGKSRCFKP